MLTSIAVIISGLGALDGIVAMVGGSSVPLGIWLWVFSCSAVRFGFLVSGGITPARKKILLTVAAAAAIPCGWIASMQPHGYHRNPLSQCINNMRQLEGAKAAWAFENKKPDGTTVEWSDFIGPDLYIKSRPECPSGGNYVL